MAQRKFNDIYRPLEIGNDEYNETCSDEDVYLNGRYKMKLFKNPLVELPEYNDMEENPIVDDKGKITLTNVFYRYETKNIKKYLELIIKYSCDIFDLETNTIKINTETFDFDKKVVFEKIKAIMEKEEDYKIIIPDQYPKNKKDYKELFFEYDNKLFYLYKRYNFAFSEQYVLFKRVKVILEELKLKKKNRKNDDDDDDDDDDDEDEEEENNDDGEFFEIRYEGKYIYKNNDLFYKDHPEFITRDSIKMYMPKNAKLSKKLSDHVYAFKIVDKTTNVLEAFGLYR